MEDLIARTVVETCALPAEWSAMTCSFWHWAFWASFVIGVVGGLVSFFLRGSEVA
jgi:hypothetical protein